MMSTSTPSVATSNPRKFAEKIALHNQKGAEETAEFTKIMAECAAVMATRVRTTASLRSYNVSTYFFLSYGRGVQQPAWESQLFISSVFVSPLFLNDQIRTHDCFSGLTHAGSLATCCHKHLTKKS